MSNIQNPHVIAVALGATIGVISAAGLFIYQKVMEQKERTSMMNNLESVNRRVSELQTELETLRAQQNQLRQKKSRGMNRKRIASSTSLYSTAETDNEVDAVSVTETDVDDEFYDCSDDEINADFELNGTAGVMTAITEQLRALDLKMEKEHLYEEVLCDLRELAIWHENNVEVVWRLARACFKRASKLEDTDQQEALVQEGMKICEKILEMEHMELHKYYALLVGLRTEYLPTREKLQAGKLFEKHVRKGLELKPTDSVLNHLLGRFQFNVAGLSWIERKACATLFGEAPSSTYEEAIESLERAEKYIDSPDIENKFFLGQCYIKTKAYKKGVDILKEVHQIPARTDKQEKMKKDAADLVAKYSTYCS